MVDLLECIPNGPIRFDPYIENLVDMSLNLGIVRINDDSLRAVCYVRSPSGIRMERLNRKLDSFARICNVKSNNFEVS